MRKIDVTVAHRDERGEIADLVDGEIINAITRITIRKGKVRGNHYHKATWQWNYMVSGKMRLVTQFPDAPVEEILLQPGDLVVTDPEERHALVGVEDCEVLVFTKGPRACKEYESDTFRLDRPLVK